MREALAAWERLHQGIRRSVLGSFYHDVSPLHYRDHGVSLEILDRRFGRSVFTLEKSWRDVYLYAAQIRTRRGIKRHFAGSYSSDQIDEILERCVGARLMFREGGRLLSLASALRPDLAADRIRKSHLMQPLQEKGGNP